jgi:hypothetical protein
MALELEISATLEELFITELEPGTTAAELELGTTKACEEEEYVIAGTAEELEAKTAADELTATAAELCSTDAELGKTDAELVPAGIVSAAAPLDAGSAPGRTEDAEEAITPLSALATSSELQLTRAAEIPATQKPYRICLSTYSPRLYFSAINF